MSERARSAGSIAIVAVAMEPTDITERYLLDHGVEVDLVVPSIGRALPTPTLVTVNAEGEVERSWVGRLGPAQEDELLSVLF